MFFQHTPHSHGRELYFLSKQIVGNPLRSPSSCLTHRLRIMVSISGVIFILASLDGRLDLSDNSDSRCSLPRFIQRYNVERAIPHRRAVFVTEPVSEYISSHFWRIRIFRISSFMLRRYKLKFDYEKKKCSVSIDTLHFFNGLIMASNSLFIGISYRVELSSYTTSLCCRLVYYSNPKVKHPFVPVHKY